MPSWTKTGFTKIAEHTQPRLTRGTSTLTTGDFCMTTDEFRDWQQRMGYTNVRAASAIGMSLSGYNQLRQGVSRTTGQELAIDKRTALACVALEVMAADAAVKVEQNLELPDACRPMLLELINAVSMGAWRPLASVEELVQADPSAAKTLCYYLETQGENMTNAALNALRSMLARKEARRVLGEIELDDAKK
jgi:hypothetical protein